MILGQRVDQRFGGGSPPAERLPVLGCWSCVARGTRPFGAGSVFTVSDAQRKLVPGTGRSRWQVFLGQFSTPLFVAHPATMRTRSARRWAPACNRICCKPHSTEPWNSLPNL